MHQKLRQVTTALDEWCHKRGIDYDIACDQQDLQGLLLFKRDMSRATELINHLRPLLESEGIHARVQRVRSGVILAFSLKGLSESDLAKLTGTQPIKSDFADRITGTFDGTYISPTVQIEKPTNLKTDLLRSARQLRENNYKYPTTAMDSTCGGTRFKTFSGNKKKIKEAGNHKILRHEAVLKRVDAAISELTIPQNGTPPTPGGADGLAGMGANHQPADLFQRFNAALQELGNQTSGQPLQNELRRMGIKWKKSEDGQALIFFVTNADTKAPQPIARIDSNVISKPQDFQKALSQMLDLSKGQAPGTGEQEKLAAQEADKRLREIATQMAPEDPSKQAAVNQMAPPTLIQKMQPQPQAQKPQNNRVSALAAQAKKPKLPSAARNRSTMRPKP